MSKFERYHIQDPLREKVESIEKSAEDYYHVERHGDNQSWITPILDENSAILVHLKTAEEKEMCKETITIALGPDEKSKSKTTKREPKKNNSKSNAAAMEKM